MKKIMHVITGLGDGGAEGVLTRLCLLSKNLEHEVVSLIDAGKYGEVLVTAGIKVHYLKMNPARPNPLKLIKLISIIRESKPSVVQTWMYHADLLGGIAAKLAGVKRIIWGVRHSTLDKGNAKRSTIYVARLLARLSYFIPDKIVCCARKALEVHAELGYDKSKLTLIPNGYDLESLRHDPEAGFRIRKELCISKDSFLIGKVGRYDPFKDHSNLLKALSIIKNSGIEFTCLLVGNRLTTENKLLTKEIADLGLIDCIQLVGQRADIPAIMNALDLHVLASSSEAFPNVLAEAMACGVVCVSTDVGDAKEILNEPNFICSPKNPEMLSELIIKAQYFWVNDKQRWSEFKQHNIDRIRSQYSIASMVRQYEQCWVGK
ncbi:glycosyltransferase family 4 protein [Aeromonas allosaccharophila]|uniref:glycosyltransferase family 4 protein n=1 Tax=Aeromonas allosaccharophila TaxID=656 RepID=UPI0009E7962E|nr:glycosyltransferase [Aeromonas allosaccharophila]BBQ52396.1 glycosyl transferase [Aeromonas veronii]